MIGLATLTLFGWPGASQAQPQPQGFRITPGPPQDRYPRVAVWGQHRSDYERLPDGRYRDRQRFLRRALPIGDIRSLVHADDEPVTALVYGSVSLIVEIDDQGGVADCRVERADRDLGGAACQRIIERLRMTPALDQSGQRVPDAYWITISYEPDTRPNEDWVQLRAPPPAPPAPPPPGTQRRIDWPPYSSTPGVEVEGLRFLAEGETAPSDALWAGITIREIPGGGVQCDLRAPAGDQDFDKEACGVVLAARFTFPNPGARDNRYSLRLMRLDGEWVALAPIHQQTQAITMTDDNRQALAAALPSTGSLDQLRLRVEVGLDGRATDCDVTATSGEDALDIAACRHLREQAYFSPARDIFGIPVLSHVWNWTPALPAR